MFCIDKGLTHIKYNKFAPSPAEAELMNGEEFRQSIYKKMKAAEVVRRAEQRGAVGNQVSDDYLESL